MWSHSFRGVGNSVSLRGLWRTIWVIWGVCFIIFFSTSQANKSHFSMQQEQTLIKDCASDLPSKSGLPFCAPLCARGGTPAGPATLGWGGRVEGGEGLRFSICSPPCPGRGWVQLSLGSDTRTSFPFPSGSQVLVPEHPLSVSLTLPTPL